MAWWMRSASPQGRKSQVVKDQSFARVFRKPPETGENRQARFAAAGLMSRSSSALPHRQYGTVRAAEENALAVAKPSYLGNKVAWRRRHEHRLLVLAAIALVAAVFGLVYARPPTTTEQSINAAGAASLTDVATRTAPTPVPMRHARSHPKAVLPTSATASTELSPLSFEALNFYHKRDGKPASLYPWLKGVKLIEPHRDTTLLVSSPRDGFEYIWEVRAGHPVQGDLLATASGMETVMVLTTLDENMVTLKEVNSDGEVVRRLDEMVMVKYVRREIRTLTDEEREELLDAMYALWDVPVNRRNAKDRFGNDYADIYAIARLHFKAAMNKTCDHFHDGLGFLTSHTLLSNTFEYNLQRVNPKLALPYWDFTIEGVDAANSGDRGGFVINSPLFQDSWFGSADPNDNTVKDGRWAYTKAPTMSMYVDNPEDMIPDAYGRLRSSWTVNPSPYLTRGMGKLCEGNVTDVYPWPTCEMHHSMITDYTDFTSWIWEGMGPPHGPVHTWIGGLLNCEDVFGTVRALVGKGAAKALALYTFDQRKNLWLDGFFACKSNAANVGMSVDELFSTRRCGCLGYDLSQGDDWKTIYYNSAVNFDDAIGEFDDDTKRSVVAAVCASTIYNGDHIEAGSSLDPTFWPIHPTMERLFMFSVLTGHTTDLTWPDSTVTYTDSDGNAVYDIISKYGDKCHGHGGSDIFPFGLVDTDTDGFEIKTGIRGNLDSGNKLTNRQVLTALDASVNMLPYVYDTFKWDHCLDAGIDFEDAWETVSAGETKQPNTRQPSSNDIHSALREGGQISRSSYQLGTKTPGGSGGGRNGQ